MKNKLDVKDYCSEAEKEVNNILTSKLKTSPIPDDQFLENLGLFLSSKNLSRILFMNHIYQKIIDVQGVIFDFGTRWGQNMALFSSLRGIYEPFNRHRKIIGFDTFSGFPGVSKEDGDSDLMKKGNVSVTKDYADNLEFVLNCHEFLNPLGHIKKFEIRKGDATNELEHYLIRNPQTIVSLAYFDFDLYDPTFVCLEAIRPLLVKGSVLCFDELNDHDSPGETIALKEVFGLNNVRLKRFQYTSRISYFVVE